VFYALALVAARGVAFLPSRPRAGVAHLVREALACRLRPVWMALPTTVLLLAQWPGGLAATAAVHAVLLLCFGLGWFLYGHRDLLAALREHATTQIALAAAAIPLITGSLRESAAGAGPDGIAGLAGSAGAALWMWLLTFGVTGISLRILDRPAPALRSLSDASYFVYLVHLPVVLWVGGGLVTLPLPAIAKASITIALSLALILAVYHVAVRSTAIGQLLNGRRYPRGGPLQCLRRQSAALAPSSR
jgi:peptidoglycan/LPS O-acetylase OafA/YrhL